MGMRDPFNGWEQPAFCIGQVVRNGDRVGIVYGFVAWEFPIVLYAVRLAGGDCETWHRGDLVDVAGQEYRKLLEVVTNGA